MYRFLIYHRTVFRKPIKWTTKLNGPNRSIHLSLGRRNIEFSDDMNSICYTERGTTRLSRNSFVDCLKTMLNCPVTVAREIWFTYPVLGERCLYDVESNVKLLTEKGVTTILDNPSLLSLKRETLRSRLAILESMSPDKIEDFLPLAMVADDHLNKIKAIAEVEAHLIPGRHRIYHFSKLLDMKPHTLSQHLSGRPFMLELPFTEIDHRIKAMLLYKTPAQIVSHLWTLQSSEQFDKSMRRVKWAEYLNSGGKEHTMYQYFVNRLDYDIKKTETMLKAYPYLVKMDVQLLDAKLDFLLNEVGVDASEIIYRPRILSRNLETITERFHELQFYGYGHHQHDQIIAKLVLDEKQYNEFLVKLKQQCEQHEPQYQSQNFIIRKLIDLRKMFRF